MKDIDPDKFYEIFERELRSDDKSWSKKGTHLLNYYNSCNEHEQSIINNLFMDLCGWSFDTILEMSKKERDENRD